MKQPKHTLAVSLDDWPQWHRGIRQYAVWCLPVNDPQWLAFIDQAQTQLSPWLHPGYERQPHITLFAAGLVDKNHYSADMRAAQIESLELYSLSPVLLTPSILSTFATAPWLGIEDVNNRLGQIRTLLEQSADEDSPAPQYQPHVTLGFYRHQYATGAIMKQLEALQEQLLALPPLQIERLQLCYYNTRETQGRLRVEKTIELNNHDAVEKQPDDPLQAVKEMRQTQLKACALKQKDELEQLLSSTDSTEKHKR